MNDLHKNDLEEMKKLKKQKKDKWEFEDYAFTITGIIVGFLLIVPDLLYSQLGIVFLGGSLGGNGVEIEHDMLYGWTINSLRALSPMLFMLTTTICFIHDAIIARKTGGYQGSVFNNTFESLVEDAIYMAITTIMVYGAVFLGMMYISWLSGPITWVLFMVIFPIVRKKTGKDDELHIPWLLLVIFALGVIVEVFTGAWIAFPLAWLVICAFKLVSSFREYDNTVDSIFDILYYIISIVLMALGIILNFWITSWIAFPFAFLLCWILSKFERFKRT